MQMNHISIKNYRSIVELRIDCMPQNGNATFGLIGLNEAGKSSILKAITLAVGLIPATPKDFHDSSLPIIISFSYELGESVDEGLAEIIEETLSESEKLHFEYDQVDLVCEYSVKDLSRKLTLVVYEKDIDSELLIPLKEIPNGLFHTPIFWTADDRYLISKPIDLAVFSANPEAVSIPLRNCFLLAGVVNIQERITALQHDSTEVELLAAELGDKVTEHIISVWPDHPIKISFLINNGSINFHVKDTGASGKAKTADQRSDGFKQFVSFLLTVSAQNKNQELSKTILLLDEPETHLHPLAQEYLLSELIRITSNERSNIVFFATHSNYLIDKFDLSRNLKIEKVGSQTKLKKFDSRTSSYASVTYEVFDIPSSDYHNELYGRLQEIFVQLDEADERRCTIKSFDENFCVREMGLKKLYRLKGVEKSATLPTYIRNCIHHSDNGDKFDSQSLKESIELMRKQLTKLTTH